MNPTLTLADRPTLTAEIATLDFLIHKLSKLFNADSYKIGSLFITGKSFNKDFSEMINWKNELPLPGIEMKKFFQLYTEKLIIMRLHLIKVLDHGLITFEDKSRIGPCDWCADSTRQRNYFVIPGRAGVIVPTGSGEWICNNCESILPH